MSTNGTIPPGDGGKMPESPAPPPVDEKEPVTQQQQPDPAPEPEQPPQDALETVAASGTAEALIREYQAAVKWNSLVRVIFPVFVLALIITFGAVTAANIMGAFPEKRITQETVKAGEELMPILNDVIRAFVDEVAPKLAKEFQRGLEEGGERLGVTLGAELERLQSSTDEKLKERIHTALEVEKARHKALLLQLYPDLKDDQEKLEKLAVRLNRAFEMWTVRYLLSIVEDYYLAMAKINDTVIKGYRPAPEMQGKSMQEAEMLELFMELMNAAYAETPEGMAAGTQELAPLPEKPAAEAVEEPVAADALIIHETSADAVSPAEAATE